VVPFPEDHELAIAKECSGLLEKNSGEKLGFVNFEGCITAKAMVAGLERMGKEPSRNGLILAMQGFKGVDIGGVSLSISPENHQALNHVYMTQIRNGKIAKLR
jgi:hypothetical protein